MTVSTDVTRVIVEGNGASTSFAYSFPIAGTSDTDQTNCELILTDSSGVSTTLANNLWSITGVVTDITDGVGGNFTYSPGSPIASGNFLTLNRTQPYLQPTTLSGQGAYSPAVVENALDNLALQTEQLNTRLLQTVRAPITDDALSDLPTAALRANSFLYFDNSGNVSTVSSTTGIASSILVGTNSTTALEVTELLLTGSAVTSIVNASGVATATIDASSLSVTDGSTTVSAVTSIHFTANATVSSGGAGIANVANTGSSGGSGTPGGRLTLTSGSPVMSTNAVAVSTVYYDTYVGNTVPVWNGSSFTSLTITADEISLTLTSTHSTASNVFDVFAINNASSLVIATGPAWSSTTSRGTGAGTTELQLKNGIWTNKNALTHAWNGTTDYGSVSANQATYLGSVYTTGAGQTGMAMKPAAASGGTNNFLGLYNAYNRVLITAIEQDSTANWNYATSTARPTNNSTSNRISWLDGLAQSSVAFSGHVAAFISASTPAVVIWVNVDSTSAFSPTLCQFLCPAAATSINFNSAALPLLGLHYVQQMEYAQNGTATFVSEGNYQYLILSLAM